MSTKISKLLAIFLVAVMFIGALPINAFAFAVDPKVQVIHADSGTSSYSSLSSAVNAAVDGDTVTLAGEVMNLTLNSGVTITKNITFSVGKDFNANKKSIQYNGTNTPLFTVENGGVLTIYDSEIYGNQNASLLCGGFVLVKKGGTLILDGKAGSEVTIKNFKLTAQNSMGGTVYCEQGGKVIVNGAVFSDNSAANGADIYAEQQTDVTVAEGITLKAAYGESVDINALNLVLTGEIGLVFHTVVPEKYLGGSFVLTSRTSDTVIYKISECGKDSEGRYLAKYNLASVELSEPVTLTVCDINGVDITSKTKSAEEYGNVILDDEFVTKKEKDVVRTLLNYGHFAQIESAEFNSWEIGEKFAETAKYSDLTTDINAFNCYQIKYLGCEPKISKIGVQLDLGYKTDINLYFPIDEEPLVKVNGEIAEVESYEYMEYRYRITIKEISALDLAKTFEILINDKLTMTLSAMSYCKLAVEQNGVNSVNAVKALYEFYQATVNYNVKPVSPGEDTD